MLKYLLFFVKRDKCIFKFKYHTWYTVIKVNRYIHLKIFSVTILVSKSNLDVFGVMPRNSPKNQSPQVRLGLSIGDFEFFGEFHGVTPKTPMYLKVVDFWGFIKSPKINYFIK